LSPFGRLAWNPKVVVLAPGASVPLKLTLWAVTI
jgi:hypothetical protein